MDKDEQSEMLAIVERSLDDFRKGMEAREQLSIRIGRRTTQIIRFGMTGLSILGLALFYLIFILTRDFSNITSHMTEMSGYMQQMEQSFVTVAGTIEDINTTMQALNTHIAVMPELNSSVAGMDDNLGILRSDMHTLVTQIDHMNANVAAMTSNLQLLNTQFSDMNRTVASMAANMHQMAKPMKVFPF